MVGRDVGREGGGERAWSSFCHVLSRQRKLYVRHVPLDKKESDIHALFSTYGKVMDIDYHTKDSSKLYVVGNAYSQSC